MAKSYGALEKYLAQKGAKDADEATGKMSAGHKFALKSRKAKKIVGDAEDEAEPKKMPSTKAILKALGMSGDKY